MDPHARARWTEAGALTTAGTVAATIFCCLPFATGVFGAGLASVGARFAPLRPYLTGVSVACLGYAFYHTYRPGAVHCTPDGCQAPHASRGRQAVLWIISLAVVLLLTVSWWADSVIYWTL